jgi:hypothetical protein
MTLPHQPKCGARCSRMVPKDRRRHLATTRSAAADHHIRRSDPSRSATAGGHPSLPRDDPRRGETLDPGARAVMTTISRTMRSASSVTSGPRETDQDQAGATARDNR